MRIMREGIESIRTKDAGYGPRSPEVSLEHQTECGRDRGCSEAGQGAIGENALVLSAIYGLATTEEEANVKGEDTSAGPAAGDVHLEMEDHQC